MQPRYNVFNQIHKGLRAFMYDTALQIQQADFAADNAGTVIAQVRQVLDLFDEHAHHEDLHLLPLIADHNAELMKQFEQDHEVDHRLSATLREHCTAWGKAHTASDRITYGQAIFYAFNEFVAFNLYHMNKEEQVLLYTLWKHHTDETLLAAEQAIVQSIAPETLMFESRWMMRALSNPEIVQWLTGVRMGAPAEVFQMFAGMAEEELTAERWDAVATALKLQPAVI